MEEKRDEEVAESCEYGFVAIGRAPGEVLLRMTGRDQRTFDAIRALVRDEGTAWAWDKVRKLNYHPVKDEASSRAIYTRTQEWARTLLAPPAEA